MLSYTQLIAFFIYAVACSFYLGTLCPQPLKEGLIMRGLSVSVVLVLLFSGIVMADRIVVSVSAEPVADLEVSLNQASRNRADIPLTIYGAELSVWLNASTPTGEIVAGNGIELTRHDFTVRGPDANVKKIGLTAFINWDANMPINQALSNLALYDAFNLSQPLAICKGFSLYTPSKITATAEFIVGWMFVSDTTRTLVFKADVNPDFCGYIVIWLTDVSAYECRSGNEVKVNNLPVQSILRLTVPEPVEPVDSEVVRDAILAQIAAIELAIKEGRVTVEEGLKILENLRAQLADLFPMPPSPIGGGGSGAVEPRRDYDESDLQIVCSEWVGSEEKVIRVGQVLELEAESGDPPYAWKLSEVYSSSNGVYHWPKDVWFGKQTRYGRQFWFTVTDTGWKELPAEVMVKLSLIDKWNPRKQKGNERVSVKVRLLLDYGDVDGEKQFTVNGDKRVTVKDAELLQKFLAGEVKLSETQQEAADVDGNGKVDANDLALLEQYLVGAIEKFPKQEREEEERARKRAQANLAPARNTIVSPRGKFCTTWAKIRAR